MGGGAREELTKYNTVYWTLRGIFVIDLNTVYEVEYLLNDTDNEL